MVEIKNIAVPARASYERKALEPFLKILDRYRIPGFTKQGLNNRVIISKKMYFQFGDLRVDTDKRHIIIEVDHGGVTNLVKYWQCIEQGLITKPVILLQIYRKDTEGDYASHIGLWSFLRAEMSAGLGDKFSAHLFTYHPEKIHKNLATALMLFEDLLKR
jgi:hypothetical protein